MNNDRLDAELAARPLYAQGDLAPVGYEHFSKHQILAGPARSVERTVRQFPALGLTR